MEGGCGGPAAGGGGGGGGGGGRPHLEDASPPLFDASPTQRRLELENGTERQALADVLLCNPGCTSCMLG